MDDLTKLKTAFSLIVIGLYEKERQKKVDEAVKIMKLVSLFPELKESGILTNLLG